MITHPKAEELVAAVAAWIEEIRPTLDPRNAFLARVAANALGTVQRELTLGPAAERALAERLAGILGEAGEPEALVTRLCERIRSGEITTDTPGLVKVLKASALEQIAIDQPNYRHEGLAGRS